MDTYGSNNQNQNTIQILECFFPMSKQKHNSFYSTVLPYKLCQIVAWWWGNQIEKYYLCKVGCMAVATLKIAGTQNSDSFTQNSGTCITKSKISKGSKGYGYVKLWIEKT